MNAVQEELASFIEAQGVTLNKSNNAQLLAAFNVFMTALFNAAHSWTAEQSFVAANPLKFMLSGDQTLTKDVGGLLFIRNLARVYRGRGIARRVLPIPPRECPLARLAGICCV
jgi:hypothetical protein